MAESSMHSRTSEDDTISLKEALYSQHQLLQQVQYELEVEREAAETAASEALSMILRLQAEKAALKLEASQYKRIAEEKMSHVEESHFLLEDLIYEKEMEIASLEFQIQAYRRKLRSLGCSDIGTVETRLPESLLLHGRNSCNGEMSPIPAPLARRNSLPVINLMDSFQKRSDLERQRSSTALSELDQWKEEEKAGKEYDEKPLDLNKKTEDSGNWDLNSYWSQVKKKDQKVKDRSDCKDPSKPKVAKTRNRSGLPPLQQTVSTKLCDRVVESSSHEDSSYSATVHDVFEVPQVDNSRQTKGDSETLDSENTLQESSDLHVGKPDSELQTSSDLHVGKLDAEPQESSDLHVGKLDSEPQESSDLPANETERLRKKLHLLCANHVPHTCRSSRTTEGMKMERISGPQHTPMTAASSYSDFQQLVQRVERLEGERNVVRMPEIDAESNLQLSLLNEIREQLDSIQSELRSWRTRVQPPRTQPTSNPIEEVMLRIWL